MNDILKALNKKNHFNYLKMDAENMKFDDEKQLAGWAKENIVGHTPFLLMQHHYWMNFTNYGVPQPTMINVIRNPIEWFSSHYHFHLYGWQRSPGERGARYEAVTLDECVLKKKPQCVENSWRYIEFFTGSSSRGGHNSDLNSESEKARAVKHAKTRLVKDYHVIGVLEQFEDTLELFEHMLPNYYKGAMQIWHSKKVQDTREATKSLNHTELSEEAREVMTQKLLLHEMDLYTFTVALFNERLARKRMPEWKKQMRGYLKIFDKMLEEED